MNTGRKWFIKAAALACAAMLMTPLTAFAGWQKEGDTYAYYEEDGTRVVNDFRRSGNQWFYLDENGHILKNCQREINGKLYTFNERGAMDSSPSRRSGEGSKSSVSGSSFTAISSR